MTTPLTSSSERVKLGCQKLDEKIPNWIDKINLDTFCISSFRECPLGQIFDTNRSGYFSRAFEDLFKIGWDEEECYNIMHNHGFYSNLKHPSHYEDLQDLQKEWVEELNKRKNNK